MNVNSLLKSPEELEFISGTDDLQKGSDLLLDRGPKLVVVTDSKKGTFFNKGSAYGMVPNFKVDPVDFLGAGDSFMAALLYMLLKTGTYSDPDNQDEKAMYNIIKFANAAGALATRRKGAIPSFPVLGEVEELIKRKVYHYEKG